MNKPLVTFTVSTYNQERFIREAVEGAFAQTYSPLEILLSDDCSTDQTFAIMRDMAATYRGPHKVVLNRNARNMGVTEHINYLTQAMSGEFFVGSAGDDVSLPERTAKCVDRWLSSGRTSMAVYSDAVVIDEFGALQHGNYFQVVSRNEGDVVAVRVTSSNGVVRVGPLSDPRGFLDGWILGATSGYDRKVFKLFKKLRPGVIQEDIIFPLRALILGNISYIDEPLVRYRRYSGNQFPESLLSSPDESHANWAQAGRLAMFKSMRDDVKSAEKQGLLAADLARKWDEELNGRIATQGVELSLRHKRPYKALIQALSALVTTQMSSDSRKFVLREITTKTGVGRVLTAARNPRTR
jgi:hypothetical protein